MQLKACAKAVTRRLVSKKKQICKNSLAPDFAAIDEHVKNTPQEATESLESLAEYLNSFAANDLQRVRAIYKWITTNITYDTDGLAAMVDGKLPILSNDAASALKNRCCVCDGYSRLMVALCQLVGIECIKLFGYSKDTSFNPTISLADMKPDHAWNAVKLDGHWRLIEATWGAGALIAGKFVQKPNDFFFLTDPAIFLESHLPLMDSGIEDSKKWQLLDNPIDLEMFHRQVVRTPSCFNHQVELVSHTQAIIDVPDEVTLQFRGTGKTLNAFSAHFVDRETGEELSDGRHIAVVLDQRTNEVTVTARPPTSGVPWQVRLFGTTKKPGAEVLHQLEELVSYWIRADSQPKVPRFLFPNYSRHYGFEWNPKRCGFTGDFGPFWVRAKGEHELRLPITSSIPKLAAWQLGLNDEFTFVEMSEGFLTISLRMHQAGFHKLQLFCKDLTCVSNDFPLVATFLVECTSPMKQPRPFPHFSSFAVSERVTLVSPRDRELPANSQVDFKLSSPTLNSVLVKHQITDAIHSKCADTFSFSVNTGAPGEEVDIFGAVDPKSTQFIRVFNFKVAKIAAS